MMQIQTFEDVELEKVQTCCNKYDYQAFLRFNEIHIRTEYESWYFVPRENGSIKLMHGNCVGHFCDKWHRQFHRYDMNYDELIQYVHEHERAKYTCKFISFSFTKYGAPRQAVTL